MTNLLDTNAYPMEAPTLDGASSGYDDEDGDGDGPPELSLV